MLTSFISMSLSAAACCVSMLHCYHVLLCYHVVAVVVVVVLVVVL